MKKKGLTITNLILYLVVFAVLLFIAGKVGQLLYASTEEAECQWNQLVAAIAKSATLGSAQVIPFECQHAIVDVNKEAVQRKEPAARREIKQLTTDRQQTWKNSGTINIFTNADSKEQTEEWALNSLLAEEVKGCWGKMWHGKVDAFDEWHGDALSWEWAEGIAQAAFFESDKFPVATCVVCSAIKFSAADPIDRKQPITSFDEFMKAALVPKDPGQRTYAQFFEDTTDNPLAQQYPDAIAVDQPLAVVYVRYTKPKLAQWLDVIRPYQAVADVYSLFTDEELGKVGPPPDYTSVLKVVPFTTKDLKAEQCNVYID